MSDEETKLQAPFFQMAIFARMPFFTSHGCKSTKTWTYIATATNHAHPSNWLYDSLDQNFVSSGSNVSGVNNYWKMWIFLPIRKTALFVDRRKDIFYGCSMDTECWKCCPHICCAVCMLRQDLSKSNVMK